MFTPRDSGFSFSGRRLVCIQLDSYGASLHKSGRSFLKRDLVIRLFEGSKDLLSGSKNWIETRSEEVASLRSCGYLTWKYVGKISRLYSHRSLFASGTLQTLWLMTIAHVSPLFEAQCDGIHVTAGSTGDGKALRHKSSRKRSGIRRHTQGTAAPVGCCVHSSHRTSSCFIIVFGFR